MEYTTNLNLKKPDINEYYNVVEQENENADIIDEAIGKLNSDVGTEELTTEAQDCKGAINELNKNLNDSKVTYFTLHSTSLATTTKTTSATHLERKFSDYNLINVTLYVGGYYRVGMVLPSSHFQANPITLSYVDGNNVQRGVDISYVSDTSYALKCGDNFSSSPHVNILGLK